MNSESIMFLNNISSSRSDVIDECLLKYKRKYVEKLPGYEKENEDALNFGSYIHRIFEMGYKLTHAKDLMRLAETEKGTYKVGSKHKDKTKICIENFIRWNSQLGETVGVELKYEVFLDEAADITAIGVIDRVIKGSKGGYLVIDYKTSKREKKKHELLQNGQMMGYAYAIHKLYNVPISQITVAHYYPVTGHFITVKFSKIQIHNWRKKMIDKVWRIRKKKADDFPPMRNMFCNWCDHQPSCDLFNSPEVVAKRLDEQKKIRDDFKESQKDVEDGLKGRCPAQKKPT